MHEKRSHKKLLYPDVYVSGSDLYGHRGRLLLSRFLREPEINKETMFVPKKEATIWNAPWQQVRGL